MNENKNLKKEVHPVFQDIVKEIRRFASSDFDFETASQQLNEIVETESNFIEILTQIGTIPEEIVHDSTEEKLYSKTSDSVLARALRELGLKATVLRERADSADVLAKSKFHEYSLVADAKAFRMSRTAKNQKDFKVVALSEWRKDCEYALLCAPYFQYPINNSQIYAQAITNNVCLITWEHLAFLIKNKIEETPSRSLSGIWRFCGDYAEKIKYSESKKSFIKDFNKTLLSFFKLDEKLFCDYLKDQIKVLKERGQNEKEFWETQIKNIQRYTREEAIDELLKANKIQAKIDQIESFMSFIQGVSI